MFEREQNITRYPRILVTSMLIMCHTFEVSGYNEKKHGIIYILIWTSVLDEPFNFIEMGENAFNKCAFKNCYLTGDHNYFANILEFEVIMFNVVLLKEAIQLPTTRSNRQKYIMYGVEPAMFHYIPPGFNGYFNLTFTYKLSSNNTIPYIVIKDENEEIIGPKVDMYWMKLSEMRETSDYVKNKLQNKRVAAAWIVSNCWTPWRTIYANDLKAELARYGHSLDIYGKCGIFNCPQDEKRDECYALIESDYYFYLSFENSFGEDYVTEKILNALEHFAVPVVFGGANYSRFMPEGIYLDANILKPRKMAERMNEIIKDKNKYYEFFKWHEHYSFHFSGEDQYHEEICRLCDLLNNSRNQTSILEHLVEWWYEEHPIWPATTTSAPDNQQNSIETFITNLLEFLDPSAED